jgi:hypothetical protein
MLIGVYVYLHTGIVHGYVLYVSSHFSLRELRFCRGRDSVRCETIRAQPIVPPSVSPQPAGPAGRLGSESDRLTWSFSASAAPTDLLKSTLDCHAVTHAA